MTEDSHAPIRQVFLVIDGLSPRYLGPYGNTWIETPAFNRLANESVTFECVQTSTGNLGAFYNQMHKDVNRRCDFSSPASLKSLFMTDEASLIDEPFTRLFRKVILCDPQQEPKTVEQWGASHLATFFAELLHTLESSDASVLWFHCRGLLGPWDAPLAMRDAFRDEDDPKVSDVVEAPRCEFAELPDPDELLGWQQAYAAQVCVLDECLDQVLQSPQLEDCGLLLTAPRGYPLGEHRFVGIWEDALYGELLQVPVFLKYLGCSGVRQQGLYQLSDLLRMDVLPLPDEVFATTSGRDSSRRDRLIASSPKQACMRTPAWFGTWPMNEDAVKKDALKKHAGNTSPQLFVKPDDLWEANDVAIRCADVIGEMKTVYEQMQQAGSDESVPLSEVLVEGRT